MDLATFQIIGRIGNIKRFGKIINCDIASPWWNNKECETETDWNSVTFIGKNADHVEKHFGKGDQICVRGRVRQNSYEKDGELRFTTDLTVTDFKLLSFKQRGEGDASPRDTGHSTHNTDADTNSESRF